MMPLSQLLAWDVDLLLGETFMFAYWWRLMLIFSAYLALSNLIMDYTGWGVVAEYILFTSSALFNGIGIGKMLELGTIAFRLRRGLFSPACLLGLNLR